MQTITSLTLNCCAHLVVEPMPNVSSAALEILIPAGSATDPEEKDGIAAMLCELVFRGAGGMSSREHSDAMDRLGAQRSAQVLANHLRLTFTTLGDRLLDTLPLISLMLREPTMAEDSIDPVRQLCQQSLESLADEPQTLVMHRLRERMFAPPFNRHGYGQPAVLASIMRDELREAWQQRARPKGTIIAAAGAVDPAELAGRLDALLDGATGQGPDPQATAMPERGYTHLADDTAQVHIGIGLDAPPEEHPASMHERVAMTVLAGSTSGRLFTEVRQKRSLCYSVGGSYRSGRDFGSIRIYAGTTPDRAQETLNVCLAELNRMREGVEADEFDRAITGLKASIIMQGESTPARAASLASDHFRLGRSRSLADLAAAVDAVTRDRLNEHLASREFNPLTISTIGPEPLEVPESVVAEAEAG